MINSTFKKSLVGIALSMSLVTVATASEIVFDNTLYGDTQTFTKMDFDVSTGDVTQTDTDLNGVISAGDAFSELGGSGVLAFIPTAFPGSYPQNFGYELAYEFTVDGFVTNVDLGNGRIDVGFNTGTASLTMTDIAGVNADVVLFSGALTSGSCGLNVVVDGITGDVTSQQNAGSCGVDFLMTAIEAGAFTYNGFDISTFTGLQTPVFHSDLTVQGISGLNIAYSAPGATQTFTVGHDGNGQINIPEPTSLALLGLGLLGFGAARRNKKS